MDLERNEKPRLRLGYHLSDDHMAKADELISELQCLFCDIYSNSDLNAEGIGRMRRNASGRWTINNIELNAGDGFEVLHQGHWTAVQLEHHHDYYAIPTDIKLRSGLLARFASQ